MNTKVKEFSIVLSAIIVAIISFVKLVEISNGFSSTGWDFIIITPTYFSISTFLGFFLPLISSAIYTIMSKINFNSKGKFLIQVFVTLSFLFSLIIISRVVFWLSPSLYNVQFGAILGLIAALIGFSFSVSNILKEINNLYKIDENNTIEIGYAIALSILTLGIYYIFWVYKINKMVRVELNQESISGNSTIAFFLVPFYAIYWSYKNGQNLNKINQNIENKSTLYLLLSLFGLVFIVTVLVQDDLNRLIKGEVVEKSKEEKRDEKSSLIKLGELFKDGIIDEQEYERKRKEIIDRL